MSADFDMPPPLCSACGSATEQIQHNAVFYNVSPSGGTPTYSPEESTFHFRCTSPACGQNITHRGDGTPMDNPG